MTLDIMGREDQKIYFKNRNMRHILHILCGNFPKIEFLFLALDSTGKTWWRVLQKDASSKNLTQGVSIRRSHAGTPEGLDQHSPSELKITL